jgi:hypothetical protein
MFNFFKPQSLSIDLGTANTLIFTYQVQIELIWTLNVIINILYGSDLFLTVSVFVCIKLIVIYSDSCLTILGEYYTQLIGPMKAIMIHQRKLETTNVDK